MSLSTTERPSGETYESPLTARYSSEEMGRVFSPHHKHATWRMLWVALAEAERELGLDISEEQIEEMRRHIHTIDFEKASKYEEEFHHDVMAHIHTFGDQCPSAKPIIHLGATSCYVTDNTELIQFKKGLALLREKLVKTIEQLSAFAREYADTATLSYTHFQAAQPTTVGKRACIWIQDLKMDLEELDYRIETLRFLGTKGTTGTQASFLTLFNGDHDKVKELDRIICEKMGFSKLFPISGQTYTRKVDSSILNCLAGIAVSLHKFATDLRLLSHLKEIDEPFGKSQVGSSAMPYKRNPIYTERICSLARFLISLTQNPHYTAATQWLERSLDDSANRRISISEAFLTCDAILNLSTRITKNLIVNPKVIERHLKAELPFMMTETLLMECVKRGGDRQELHEKIRQHSQAAGMRVKEQDGHNDMLERIAEDPLFPLGLTEIKEIIERTNVVGRAPQQVEEFLG